MNDINIKDEWIISRRGVKNKADPSQAYGWMVEKEYTASGKIEDTLIIFLTNKECPFHCLMCDLWKNTTNDRVSPGAIPYQIRQILHQVTGIKHIKLYNSGSFFDGAAIPREDYSEIALLLSQFETVIVESHPAFINSSCLTFRDLLQGKLEIALGLETVHKEVLRKLNKRMTLEQFVKTVNFLSINEIQARAFILLKPPFLDEQEGIHWAQSSVDFAFNSGIQCCTVIPVRGGNGAMESLQDAGLDSPPHIQSLESVLTYGISLQKGRVFADTWDLALFSSCNRCLEQRIQRITHMNLKQEIMPEVNCSCQMA
jgi:radical SAM enzyme (TIGR01210 family)